MAGRGRWRRHISSVGALAEIINVNGKETEDRPSWRQINIDTRAMNAGDQAGAIWRVGGKRTRGREIKVMCLKIRISSKNKRKKGKMERAATVS